MTYKKFTPERGQLFWYIKEEVIDDLPDLVVESSKFDPKNNDHKKIVKRGNCFLTEDDAYESLFNG